MKTAPDFLPCDGCGLPATPEHIAERVRLLELSTKYRPVHIGVLFIGLAPPDRPENFFYAPPELKDFFDPFLEALEIPSTSEAAVGSDRYAEDVSRLAEFQRKGYYLAYLSECPRHESEEPAAKTVSRLGPVLVRRIRFNYKPKYVAPLGQELASLAEMLRGAGIGHVLSLDPGSPLPIPRTGDREGLKLFQKAVSIVAPRDTLSGGLC